MAIDPDTKLSPNEAAERIGTNYQHLAKMRMLGEGPTFIKVGRRKIVYAAGEVDAWLARQSATKTGTAPGGKKPGPRPRSASANHAGA